MSHRSKAAQINQKTRPQEPSSAPFGRHDIPLEEKTHRVQALFAEVAERYDLMNDIMSLGGHRLWKSRLLATLDIKSDEWLLDLAGGTGDVACAAARRQRRAETQKALDKAPGADRGEALPEGHIVVADLTPQMVAKGAARALDLGLAAQISWLAADAETLPLRSNSFDCCTLSFGLRNMTRPDTALREVWRVLRPGGRLLCLEFSQPPAALWNTITRRARAYLLPRLGQIVAGNPEAYRYLSESITRFPAAPDLARLLASAGFAAVDYRLFSGGVTALHRGWKP